MNTAELVKAISDVADLGDRKEIDDLKLVDRIVAAICFFELYFGSSRLTGRERHPPPASR